MHTPGLLHVNLLHFTMIMRQVNTLTNRDELSFRLVFAFPKAEASCECVCMCVTNMTGEVENDIMDYC